jgi:RNA polymerase sigma-70 factor (ECF subfamily)
MEGDGMPDDPRVSEVQRLFLRHCSILRGFIVGLLGDFETADDVLHEVFLTATEKAGEFVPGSNYLAWVRAIARLKVLEHLRGRRRWPGYFPPEIVELLADDAPRAEAGLAARRAVLASCLEEVSGRARDLLELRYVDGLLPARIAEQVNWSVGAVNVALSRARRFLRDCAERRIAAEGN